MSLQGGDRIGSYEILSVIGAGGMGEVYRARDTKLHRDVAIKTLPPAFAADPDRVTRFEREAQTRGSSRSRRKPRVRARDGVRRRG
jgi:serine/threonine protein kinase